MWILITGSLVIRIIIAAFTELGNDEVYYWTYARYPDWSQFDHPSMVGWLIQLFTLNLTFSSEFFLRLPSLVFGTLSTLLIFFIGKRIKNERTGFIAALLFTASFYCFIISGTFIMPDTPQVFFWLATLYFLLESLPDKELGKRSRRMMLLAGVTTGLALLSKYHSIFLINGALLYILFYNRRWLRAKETWLALLIALILFLPVLYWNYENNFISFTFHESRVGGPVNGLRWDYFLTEVGGQFFYNNPVNVILILVTLIFFFRGKSIMPAEPARFLLLTGLPLVIFFLAVSLFRSTLPHWTGPAYLGFILIVAAWLDKIPGKTALTRWIPLPAAISLGLMLVLTITAFTQVRWGWIHFDGKKNLDVSTQLYGWKQLGEKFRKLANKYDSDESMLPSSPVLTFRWFPAANFDYYVASPDGRKVYALGDLERIHKYFWIDRERGNIPKGTDAYYIALNDDFKPAGELYGNLFTNISLPDTLPILRGNDTIRKAYVYRLIRSKEAIIFP